MKIQRLFTDSILERVYNGAAGMSFDSSFFVMCLFQIMFKIISTGQSLLLSALGPLFYAKKFVLVGDPEQLPPVVKSHVARDMGMGQSLFSHLGADHVI